jgi:hypothetical protein
MENRPAGGGGEVGTAAVDFRVCFFFGCVVGFPFSEAWAKQAHGQFFIENGLMGWLLG